MDNHMDNNPNGNRPDNNKGPGRQDPNKNHQSILAFLVCLLVTLVCFAMFTNMLKDNSSEITYDKFIEMVDDGDVKEVTLQSNTLTITPKHQSSGFSEEVYYANQMESVDKLTERLEGTGIKFEYKKPDAAGEIISMLVSVLLPTIVLFVLLMVFMRRMNKGGGMMGVGKSRAKATFRKIQESLSGMWQGRMRPRNHCRRWWISCIIPANIPPSERSCRKELCL